MELTNKQREYLGLELIKPDWERVEIPNNCLKPELSTGKDILFFEGDTLRKVIWMSDKGNFLENSYHLKTQDNRTMIAPITAKGKPKRLNGVNIQRCTPYGMYLRFGGGKETRGGFTLANYTTQKTYYSSGFAGIPFMNEREFQDFLDKWIADTDEVKLAEIHAFANAKRQHCRYREGDFFRFRYDRQYYGYGRILLDVRRFIKNGGKFWDILMGKPVCMAVYHVVTENPDVSMEDLQKLPCCPSEYIMDNLFYYGEYEIIGNAPLAEKESEIEYPIMYGPSISARDRNKICYCEGRDYREIPLEGNTLPPGDFKNNGIGYSPHLNKTLVEACVQAASNAPYWERKSKVSFTRDLRNPAFKKELEYVRRQMGISFLEGRTEI